MTHAEIQTFLAVCRCKTVTKAAEQLFISQSSLSIRLQTLERDLGGALFLRKKGSREMNLTTAGKVFYDLAVQYETLMAKMEQVCKNPPCILRVSSLNSLGSYLLPAVYERFLLEHGEAELEIQDMEQDAACRSMQQGMTDIAFTTGLTAADGFRQIPVFSEPMVFLCHKDAAYREPVTAEQLRIRREVYTPWSRPFAKWHRHFFGVETAPQVSISIMEQLKLFMKKEHSWAIVPISVARGLQEAMEVRRCETAFPLPSRDVFCVLPDMTDIPLLEPFLECLREELACYPEISVKL